MDLIKLYKLFLVLLLLKHLVYLNASNCLSLQTSLLNAYTLLCILFYPKPSPRFSTLLLWSTLAFQKLRFQGFCLVMTLSCLKTSCSQLSAYISNCLKISLLKSFPFTSNHLQIFIFHMNAPHVSDHLPTLFPGI